MIPRSEQKNPWLTNTCKGQWLGTAKSQDQGTDRRLVGMSDSSMQTELLLSLLLLFLRAGLYQNHPVWPVTSAQQLFLQGQGLELPHSDARKWDSAPPRPPHLPN